MTRVVRSGGDAAPLHTTSRAERAPMFAVLRRAIAELRQHDMASLDTVGDQGWDVLMAANIVCALEADQAQTSLHVASFHDRLAVCAKLAEQIERVRAIALAIGHGDGREQD